MPTSNAVLPSNVLVIADVIHGYVNSDLNANNRLIQSLKGVLQRKDPSKALSDKMLEAFKKKMIKRAKSQARSGKKLKTMKWGSIRNAEEGKIKEMLAPPVLVAFESDDVGGIIIPDYPDDTNFTIKYLGMYCRKETGDRGFSSFLGSSDEIYIITNAVSIVNGQNIIRSELHPVGSPNGKYGNVDTGDVRSGPIAACWSGNLNTVSLVVTVMEQDKGDPDFYREEVEALVSLAAEIAEYYGVTFAEALVPVITDLVNWLLNTEDDHVGTTTLIFDEDSLKHQANISGNEFRDGNKKTGIVHNSFAFHDEDGEYYTLFSVEADRDPINKPNAPDSENVLINTNDSVLGRDALLF